MKHNKSRKKKKALSREQYKKKFDKLSRAELFDITEASRIVYYEKWVNENSTQMRQRSGEIDDSRPLVQFLYLLIRDNLAAGMVEKQLLTVLQVPDAQFTNGWLAQYCQDVANRLLGE